MHAKYLCRRCLSLFVMLLILHAPGYARALTSAERMANIEFIHSYLMESAGYNCAAACGVLANIRHESNFDPSAQGDLVDGEYTSYGLCQWHLGRKTRMMEYCEANGFDYATSLEGQLGYLQYELENGYKKVGNYLKSVENSPQGVYDAAYYFCVHFEVPASKETKGNTRGISAINNYWLGDYSWNEENPNTVQTYTITYNANGGKNAPAAGKKTEGIPFLITTAEPTRAGFSFAGWSADKRAVRVDYAPGDTYKENAPLTLYAVWEKALEADTPPDASVSVNGHTYELYLGAYTRDYASGIARVKGGSLASVQSTDEYEVACSLIEKAGGPCWLGGEYISGNWMWESGEMFWDDFAEEKWADGHPQAIYGANACGALAQDKSGKWLDLESEALETVGFIVEYGEPEAQEFPVYLLTVKTSLNLRVGPGTSHTSLGYLYTGDRITIYETRPGSSYDWGWGISDKGDSGWCAMKIPDYMKEISGIKHESGLIYRLEEDCAAITGYVGSEKNLIIPAALDGYDVCAIEAYAFYETALESAEVDEAIPLIEKNAFPIDVFLYAAPGSPAHRYAAQYGNGFSVKLPENAFSLPAFIETLEEGAFSGASAIHSIDLRKAKLTVIPAGAFSGIASLQEILIPETVSFIAEDALSGCGEVLVLAPIGSHAAEWATEQGFETLPYNG